MKNFEIKFKTYLSKESLRINEEIKQLEVAQCLDEARFKKVEANIVDIFTQMFAISVKKIKANEPWQNALKADYLMYFNKIPGNWAENLKKCKEHNAYEEAHIEEIKIKKAASLKKAFLDALNEEYDHEC